MFDLDRLDRDAIMPVDSLARLFARDVIVAGRSIVADGEPTGVDVPTIEKELRGMYRNSVKGYAPFADAWPRFESTLSRWFAGACGCG